MFKHLLVPTDGSGMSVDTTAKAITFARETGATISFFYVKPEFPMAMYGEGPLIDPSTPQQFMELVEKQANDILSACMDKARAAGVKCDASSQTNGSIYAAIVAEAF